jgi:hypothetical protein
MGISLIGVGVVFSASLNKAGFAPLGIAFLIIGTVYMIIGIKKSKK